MLSIRISFTIKLPLELKYIRDNQAIELIPNRKKLPYRKIKDLSELHSSLINCSVNKTDMEWIDINESELFSKYI